MNSWNHGQCAWRINITIFLFGRCPKKLRWVHFRVKFRKKPNNMSAFILQIVCNKICFMWEFQFKTADFGYNGIKLKIQRLAICKIRFLCETFPSVSEFIFGIPDSALFHNFSNAFISCDFLVLPNWTFYCWKSPVEYLQKFLESACSKNLNCHFERMEHDFKLLGSNLCSLFGISSNCKKQFFLEQWKIFIFESIKKEKCGIFDHENFFAQSVRSLDFAIQFVARNWAYVKSLDERIRFNAFLERTTNLTVKSGFSI